MDILFATKIMILTLLKITYGVVINLLVLLSLMFITVLITKDKSFFKKKYRKFKKLMGFKE